MWKFLAATVALLVAVAKSVSLDNGVDQSQSKMLLQLMKRDTETCQGLGQVVVLFSYVVSIAVDVYI